MKRILFVLVTSVILFCAPALFACDKCIPPGVSDPAGNTHNYPSCYSIASGSLSSCVGGYAGQATCPYTATGGGCPEGGSGCERDACILNPESFAPAPLLTAKKCAIDVSGRCAAGGSGRSPFLR
jgi:hypothetical protein